MAHKKLTHDERSRLTAHLVGKTVKNAWKRINKREAALFGRVRSFVLGGYKEAFDTIPASFVSTAYEVKVNVSGEYVCQYELANFTDLTTAARHSERYTEGAESVTFPKVTYYGVAINSESRKASERKLAADLKAHYDIRDEHMKKVSKLEATLSATLAKITTTKRLQAEWPEGYAAYKSIFGDPETNGKASVPMVPTEAVNAMLANFPDAVPV